MPSYPTLTHQRTYSLLNINSFLRERSCSQENLTCLFHSNYSPRRSWLVLRFWVSIRPVPIKAALTRPLRAAAVAKIASAKTAAARTARAPIAIALRAVAKIAIAATLAIVSDDC